MSVRLDAPAVRLLVAATILSVAGGCVGLAWWLASRHVAADRAREMARWEERLSAMADDRCLAIDAWLTGRLGDARSTAGYPVVRARLAGRLDAVPHLREVLSSAIAERGYRTVALVSRTGEVIERHSSGAGVGDGALVAAAQAALRQDQAIADVYGSPSGPVGLLFAAPIVAGAGAAGGLVFDTDPEAFLFPLLRSEPVPTRTGETMLARADGPDAVFVAPALRGRTGALGLRRRLDNPGFAMAAALKGESRFGEFVDYRGQPVFSATRRLKSLPWGLVVKVDRAEALALHEASMRRQARAAGLLGVALLALALPIWRWRVASVRARLLGSRARTALLMDQANDGVLFIGPDGRIVDANRRVEDFFGVPPGGLTGRPVVDLRAPEARASIQADLEGARAGSTRYETVHLRADGAHVPVEVSSTAARIEGETTLVAVVRDITERKVAEARVQRMSRLYRTLSEVNQLMVRGGYDRAGLFEGVCRILAEVGCFPLAWIAIRQPDGTLEMAAAAGTARAYVDGIEVRWDDSPLGHGPIGSAIRERRAVVFHDFDASAPFAPWRERAARHGLRSAGAFPLVVAGDVVGALMMYSGEQGALQADECELVSELAGDISFALGTLAAAERHRSVEEHLRAVFESDLVGILFGDIYGGVSEANDKYLELIGYTREELVQGAVRWDTITPPEHLARDAAAIAEAREQGACTPYEKEYVRKDGSRVWVLVGFVLLEPERERSVAFIVDIGVAKTAELALAASEARTRAIVESAADGIITIDEQGLIESFNPASERMFGYAAAEVVGRNVSVLMPPPDRDRHDEYIGRYLRTGEARIIGRGREIMGRRKDGREFPLALAVAEFRLGPRRAFAGVARDLSEHRALEDQLRHAQRMEAVGRLAGGVAHDFNNLLGVITGYSEMVVRRLPSADPARAKIAEVLKAAGRASGLTRQLLAFSRRQVLAPRIVDLNDLVKDLEKMLHPLIGEDVELVVSLHPDVGAVRVDPGQIEQVVMNLAINARDAMPRGGRLTIATSEEDAEALRGRAHWHIEPGRYVRLRVEDTGEGMDEATLSRVFEPFFTTKPEGKGTGLGLATVFGIVKQSGGHVFVRSAPGQGARFDVYLPRNAQAGEDRDLVEPPAPRGAGETILLVEDQDAVREVVQQMLLDEGYHVLCAGHPDHAVDVAREHLGAIHLLLTDVVMPGCSGVALATKIVSARPGTRVLLMSGHAAEVLDAQGSSSARLPLLQKPFTREVLAAAVHEVLESGA